MPLPLKAGKTRKQALTQEPQEGSWPCQRPEVRTFDLQTRKRMTLCCFKPLVCGSLLRQPWESQPFTYEGK